MSWFFKLQLNKMQAASICFIISAVSVFFICFMGPWECFPLSCPGGAGGVDVSWSLGHGTDQFSCFQEWFGLGNVPITEYSLPVIYLNLNKLPWTNLQHDNSNKTCENVWHDILELPFFHTFAILRPSANHDRSIPNFCDRKTALTEFALLGAFTLTGLRDAFRNSEYLTARPTKHHNCCTRFFLHTHPNFFSNMGGVFNLWLVCLQTLLQLRGIFWETNNCLNKKLQYILPLPKSYLLALFPACFVPWVSTSWAPSLGKQKQTLVSDTLVDEFWSFPYLSKFSPKYLTAISICWFAPPCDNNLSPLPGISSRFPVKEAGSGAWNCCQEASKKVCPPCH